MRQVLQLCSYIQLRSKQLILAIQDLERTLCKASTSKVLKMTDLEDQEIVKSLEVEEG